MARLLSLQLLTVIAVTAVITGVYALAGPHDDDQVTAGSSTQETTTGATASPGPSASGTPSKASPSPSASATTSKPPSSPTASTSPPAQTHKLKVDVLNQSAPGGSAARVAAHARALGWKVGRVDSFRGTVSRTTVYYPSGEGKAARELASDLPGNPRVLPRFSTLSGNRLTVIVTR